MSVVDSQKVDLLYKKVIGNVTETSISAKTLANETISSPIIVLNESLWGDSATIPIPASGASTGIVARNYGASAKQCNEDTTVAGKRTWFIMSNTADAISNTTVMKNWVPPSIDPTYQMKVYAGDPNSGGVLQNQILNNYEILVDYSAGCIHFPNTVPTAVSTSGVWIEGYQYIGTLGPVAASSPTGILDFNGLTTSAQLLAIGTAGTNIAWSSGGVTHTLNVPDAATGARGVITTGAQSFAGAKTFIGAIVVNNTLSVTGTTNLAGLTSTSATLINNTLTVTGTSTLAGLTSSSATLVKANFSVTGTTGLAGLTSTSATLINAALTVTGTTLINASMTVTGDTTLSGNNIVASLSSLSKVIAVNYNGTTSGSTNAGFEVLGTGNNVVGYVRVGSSTGALTFKAPGATGILTLNMGSFANTWTLPANAGSAGNILSTDGAGVLSWTPNSSGHIIQSVATSATQRGYLDFNSNFIVTDYGSTATRVSLTSSLTLTSVTANSATINYSTSSLIFYDSISTGYVGFKAPLTAVSNMVYTLPSESPTASGMAITSTTGGVLGWGSAGGGGHVIMSVGVSATQRANLNFTDVFQVSDVSTTALTATQIGISSTANISISSLVAEFAIFDNSLTADGSGVHFSSIEYKDGYISFTLPGGTFPGHDPLFAELYLEYDGGNDTSDLMFWDESISAYIKLNRQFALGAAVQNYLGQGYAFPSGVENPIPFINQSDGALTIFTNNFTSFSFDSSTGLPMLSVPNIRLQDAGSLRFSELEDNGDNYVSFKAPDQLTGASSYTLPDDYPATDGMTIMSTTAGVMSWGNGGHIIALASTTAAQEPILNFSDNFSVTDNSGASSTDIGISSTANISISSLTATSLSTTSISAEAFASSGGVWIYDSNVQSAPGYFPALTFDTLNYRYPGSNLIAKHSSMSGSWALTGTEVSDSEIRIKQMELFFGVDPAEALTAGVVWQSTDISSSTKEVYLNAFPDSMTILFGPNGINAGAVTAGASSVIMGVSAMADSNESVVIGYSASAITTDCDKSVTIGAHAYAFDSDSIAVGYGAGNNQYQSVSIGLSAGQSFTGDVGQNVFIGTRAGGQSNSLNNNVYIGYESGLGNEYGSNSVIIGSNAVGGNYLNSTTAVDRDTDNVLIGAFAAWHVAAHNPGDNIYNTWVGTEVGGGTTGGQFHTTRSIFIGRRAGYLSTMTKDSIIIGNEAEIYGTASGSIAIGNYSYSLSGSIALGFGASATDSGQFVVSSITSVYLGNGVSHATPASVTIFATGGSGTDVAGSNITLHTGIGTGNADGGIIGFVGTTGAFGGTSISHTSYTAFQISLSSVDIGYNQGGTPSEIPLRFWNINNSFYTGFKSGSSSASVDYILPVAPPISTQYLTSTSAGVLSWSLLGSSISSMNSITADTQTFATGTSGTDFNISSSTATAIHTFNLPDASTANRGAITTGSQTIAGAKTFTGAFTVNNTLSVTGTSNVAGLTSTSATLVNNTLAVTGASTFTGNVVINANNANNAITASATSGLILIGTAGKVLTGTHSVTASGSSVTGVSTLYTTELKVGDAIKLGSTAYEIAAIASATALTLNTAYGGSTTAGITAFTDNDLFYVRNSATVGTPAFIINKTGQALLGGLTANTNLFSTWDTTTYPMYMEINSGVTTPSSDTTRASALILSKSLSGVGTESPVGSIIFANSFVSSAEKRLAQIQTVIETGSLTSGAMTFSTTNAGTFAERGRFSKEGYLALGKTASIGSMLDVITTAVGAVGLRIQTIASPTANYITLQSSASAAVFTIDNTGAHTLSSILATSGVEKVYWYFNPATYTITASVTDQKFVVMAAPVIAVASSMTVTNSANLYIGGSPVNIGAGTLTNSYAMWVDQGRVRIDDSLELNGTVEMNGSIFSLVVNTSVTSGDANITFNDNIANALSFISTDAKNYLKFISTDGLEQFKIGQSLSLPYTSVTASYTVTSQDFTVDSISGSITATLPTAVGRTGVIFNIKNSGSGMVTITTTSSQTIDGSTSQTLTTYEGITVQSTGAKWIII